MAMKEAAMTTKAIKCPYCERRLADEHGRYQHVKNVHPSNRRAHLKQKQTDDDESFADRAIAARLDIAMGEKTNDAWLLGDADFNFASSRK